MNLRTLTTAMLAVGASILWMAASTASATSLTSPPGTTYTSTIVAESEGHVLLSNPIATIECASKVEGGVDTHGEGVTAGGEVDSLSFTGCTNSWHVTVVSAGSLEVHETSEGNGTVTSTGATIEATRLGVTCRYATNNTDIGTLTAGAPATLDVSAAISFHSGSFLCGEGGSTWTGSYEIATPAALAVDPGATVKFRSVKTPVIFYGAQAAAQHNEWQVDGGNKTTCKKAVYETKTTATPSATLMLEASFSECEVLGYSQRTGNKMKMNSCKFELKQPNNSLEGNVGINCTSGSSIEFFGDGVAGDCEVQISETGNSNLGKAKYVNLGGNPSKFELVITLSGITVDRKIDGTGCGLTGTGVVTNGTFTANVIIEGKTANGVSVG